MAIGNTESHNLFYMAAWMRNKISHDQKKCLDHLSHSSKRAARSSHAGQAPLGKKIVSYTVCSEPSPSDGGIVFLSPNCTSCAALAPLLLISLRWSRKYRDCLVCQTPFSQHKDKIEFPSCLLSVFRFFFSILLFHHKTFAWRSMGRLARGV